MLSGTACGLLLLILLLRSLAVALAVHAFLRHIFLLRVALLRLTLLASNKTLVVFVPMVPLSFHFRGRSTLASLAFVSSSVLLLSLHSSHFSTVTPCCRFPACNIVGLNNSFVQSLLVYDL